MLSKSVKWETIFLNIKLMTMNGKVCLLFRFRNKNIKNPQMKAF